MLKVGSHPVPTSRLRFRKIVSDEEGPGPQEGPQPAQIEPLTASATLLLRERFLRLIAIVCETDDDLRGCPKTLRCTRLVGGYNRCALLVGPTIRQKGSPVCSEEQSYARGGGPQPSPDTGWPAPLGRRPRGPPIPTAGGRGGGEDRPLVAVALNDYDALRAHTCRPYRLHVLSLVAPLDDVVG